jgi:hypothetical protein
VVCETGVHTQGVVGASIAEVRAPGATSHFGRATVCLGVVQTGSGGMTGLSRRWGADMGLAEGNGGLLDPLEHPFMLGRNWLVLGTALMIEAAQSARSTHWMGMGLIDPPMSVAQSDGVGW